MSSYHDQQDIANTLKLRELIASLPEFCKEYFRGIEQTTSSRTRIAYAYDLKIFFDYLIEDVSFFKDYTMERFEISDLEQLRPDHIEIYMDYLSYYSSQDSNHMERTNKERAKSRKLASLRSFYTYFYKKEKITYNPSLLVSLPKLHQKHIVRLESNEVADLLDAIESGEGLTDKEKVYHKKTVTRDLTIITLLLGTGIRVSECVGLNCKDIDFAVNGIKITRKGGNEVIIYFGDEVEDALHRYLEERHKIITADPDDADALFLSLQNKRIQVRSIQNLVKKYAKLITRIKNISPHKLRSTFGTALYKETGDIYLVADVLGHKDVNTTRKHYAEIEDERRRRAAKSVTLREK